MAVVDTVNYTNDVHFSYYIHSLIRSKDALDAYVGYQLISAGEKAAS